MDQAVTVNVLVNLIGTAMGVQEEGGILVQGLSELEIECLPGDIPDSIDIDISKLALGDSFRVEDMDSIDKVTIKSSQDQILASVTQAMKEEEPVVDELEDGEEGEAGETGTESSEADSDSESSKEESGDSKEESKE